MKKILTILTMVATTTLVHAQGWLSFTSVGSGIKTNSASYYVQSGGLQANAPTVAAGGLYYYALLFSTTPLSGPASAWSQPDVSSTSQIIIATNNAVGGAEESVNNGQIPTTLTAGTTYDVAVAGWSASLGSTWSQVQGEFGNGTLNGSSWIANGFFGFVNGGTITPAASSPGSSIFPTVYTNGSLILYAVQPVPEPTTLALAGLGGLSMLLIRRRKS
jgi:hypothetical protein